MAMDPAQGSLWGGGAQTQWPGRQDLPSVRVGPEKSRAMCETKQWGPTSPKNILTSNYNVYISHKKYNIYNIMSYIKIENIQK